MPRVNRREIFADAEIQVFQATLMRTNSTSHLERKVQVPVTLTRSNHHSASHLDKKSSAIYVVYGYPSEPLV